MSKCLLYLLLLTLFMVRALPARTQTNDMEKSIVTGYAPVNGLKMYYEIHGSGNDMPLVLIHGGGSTIETSFGILLPLLAKQYKIIALELQSHGRTSDRSAPESYEQDANDVAGLLQYLKIEKANVLGFSDGGCNALQLAMSHPGLVNKIVVVSANYKRDGMIPGFFEGLEKATINDMLPLLKEYFLKVNPDTQKLQTMFERDRARRLAFKDWPDAELQSIKAPALFMAADHDVITTEHTVAMSKLLPGSKLVVLPGKHRSFIGEVGTVEKGSIYPEITAMLVHEFLQAK